VIDGQINGRSFLTYFEQTSAPSAVTSAMHFRAVGAKLLDQGNMAMIGTLSMLHPTEMGQLRQAAAICFNMEESRSSSRPL